MDKLRIHQGRGGEKLLCSAEERTGHSPAAQDDRILAADEGWLRLLFHRMSAWGSFTIELGRLRLVGLGLFAAMPVLCRHWRATRSDDARLRLPHGRYHRVS